MATYYFWDEIEDNVIEEYDENGNTIVEYTTEPTLYGSVLTQDRGGQIRLYHFDGQGNTTELTDENGNVTDTRKYSAFGEVTESTGTTEFPYQWGGRWGYIFDKDLGTYSVRRRNYYSLRGRCTTKDNGTYTLMRPLLDVASRFGTRLVVAAFTIDFRTETTMDDLPPLPNPLPPLPGDKKCTCESFRRQYTAKYTQVDGNDGKKCILNIECKDRCPSGLPGEASRPYEDEGKTKIDICLTNLASFRELALIFEHELQHARDFCLKPPPPPGQMTCKDCMEYESHAHSVNCGMLYPNDEQKRNQCIACGTYISCKGLCPESTKPDPCSWQLLGVDERGKPEIK